MIHHDTITGTSPNSIILSHSDLLKKSTEDIAVTLSDFFGKKIYGEGLDVSEFTLCYQNIFQRKVCPQVMDDNEKIFVVYNPSPEDINTTTLQFPDKYLKVSVWDPKLQKFEIISSNCEVVCIKT